MYIEKYLFMYTFIQRISLFFIKMLKLTEPKKNVCVIIYYLNGNNKQYE